MSDDHDTQLTLVVMAAGMGSRYGGLKQLDGVGPSGETLLEYSIFDALRSGFSKVVFIIRRDIESVFKDQVLARFGNRFPFECAYQEIDLLPKGYTVPQKRTKPWGTGHAVLAARSVVKGAFAVINADDFYGSSAFSSLVGFFDEDPHKNGSILAAYYLENTLSAFGTVTRGVCSAEGDYLKRIQETPGISFKNKAIRTDKEVFSGRELVSMNLWGFKPVLFDLLERDFKKFLDTHIDDTSAEFFLPTCVSNSIASGELRVSVLPVDDKWYGVTYREDRPEVTGAIRAAVEAGLYPKNLWA